MILNSGGNYIPGFDGTGPLSQGPFTGGGWGFCVMPINYINKSFSRSANLPNIPVNIYMNLQANNRLINSTYRYLGHTWISSRQAS